MTRRKLRSCSKCGVRHGPPIGNRCKRSEEEFQRLSEEMGETPETGIRDDAIPDEKGDEEDKLEAAGTTNQNTVKGMDYDSPREVDLTMEDDLASFTEFRRRKERERRGIIENDSAGSTSRGQEDGGKPSVAKEGGGQSGYYYQVPWDCLPPHLRERHPPVFRGDPPTGAVPRTGTIPQRSDPGQAVRTDTSSDDRPNNLEGVMELMMESQREQMKIQAEILQSLKATNTKKQTGQAHGVAATKAESSSSDSEGETEEWKTGFGDKLWKNVNGKRSKNPFTQSTYLNKTEPVDSFERVMIVIFKTLRQLLDANGEVRGVVRHGL